MSMTIWGYSKCSTCRNAQKWLQAHSIDANWMEITEAPPTVEQLRQMVAQSGLPLSKFFNTSGEMYRELQLKDKLPAMSEQQMLELLANNGKLIKRPLCTDGQQVTVGFKEQSFADTWGAAHGT
jgi:arsenate reductase